MLATQISQEPVYYRDYLDRRVLPPIVLPDHGRHHRQHPRRRLHRVRGSMHGLWHAHLSSNLLLSELSWR